MPAAFSHSLKSGRQEVELGESSTPDVLSKKRGRATQDTPAKKVNAEGSGSARAPAKAFDGDDEPLTHMIPGKLANGMAKPAATASAKESALATSISRADLASREEAVAEEVPKGKATKRKKGDAVVEGDAAPDEPAKGKRAKKAKPEGPYTKYKETGFIPEQQVTRRDLPQEGKTFKAVVWNIGGLRAFVKNRSDALPELVKREQPDVIGLLEHKLQEGADDTESCTKVLLSSLPDYELAALNCSTIKKGYSGTLMLIRKQGPKPCSVVKSDLECAKDEGRLVIAEFDGFYVVVAYVPNSGDGLKRLDERIKKWDLQLRDKLKSLNDVKPVILVGDLNVAHRDLDIWNVEAPHIPKSAGTTNAERESFSELLAAGYVDGFDHYHPEATAAFTYWSIRAGNRPKNRGLRLDYAVVSRALIPQSSTEKSTPALLDVFHLADLSTGDHCPVGAVLSL